MSEEEKDTTNENEKNENENSEQPIHESEKSNEPEGESIQDVVVDEKKEGEPASVEPSEEEEDDLTGIEEATEQEIVEKVTKKGKKKKKRDRFGKDKAKQEASEWIEKVIQIRRVTKVVKGGKKLSFRAVVIVGNGKGQVGAGVGKAAEVIGAIQKAVSDAKKHLIIVPLIDSTIPHEIIGREGAAKVLLKPAREGTGIIAGGAARTVLELGGVGDILSKSLGSRNPLNVARATLNGLTRVKLFKDVATLRGMKVKEMLVAS